MIIFDNDHNLIDDHYSKNTNDNDSCDNNNNIYFLTLFGYL